MSDFSISNLVQQTGMHQRTLTERFRDVKPHRIEGKARYFTLQQVLVALAGDFVAPECTDIGEAKMRRESALATLAEMDVAERRGELVNTSEVCRQWSQVGTNIKNKMLALPTRAAPMLIRAASLPEISSVLSELVHEALEELSATPPGAPPQVQADEAA